MAENNSELAFNELNGSERKPGAIINEVKKIKSI